MTALELISDVLDFAGASEKKLMTFHDNDTVQKGSGGNTIICLSKTSTILVSSATCGACGKWEFAVAEVENKCKGLAFSLKLKCTNVEVLPTAYASHDAMRTLPAVKCEIRNNAVEAPTTASQST